MTGQKLAYEMFSRVMNAGLIEAATAKRSTSRPITKRSGKCLYFVHMRYACNARLRQALYHWSRTSIQHDDAARVYYDALRARGHGHARALRSVADRWLRILVAMLTTRTLYDPSRLRSVVSATA